MKQDPTTTRSGWTRLRESEVGLHTLDIADRIGVTECELVASACGASGEVSATRLDADWKELIRELPRLGLVETVTRNPSAVIEVVGTYGNVEFHGTLGASLSSVDLRIFATHWVHGFAVADGANGRASRGLQFFDRAGQAIHKLYLRDESDGRAFDELVREHTAADQSAGVALIPPDAIPSHPDGEIDVAGLRDGWLRLRDVHDFRALLRRFEVGRAQAFRLVGGDLARRVAPTSFHDLLGFVAGTDLEIMIFVGNPGAIQIRTGAIRRFAPEGPWISVVEPRFDLRVRADRIRDAWVVRKPTVDGIVTALELFDAQGEQIALLVGKRKRGQRENERWRSTIEQLAAG